MASRVGSIVRIPNIGPGGQRHRLRSGVIAFGAALLLGGILFGLDVPPVWRLTVFPLVWIAALGFFQARYKT